MDVTDETGIFNPLAPGYTEDPYSHFAIVRSSAPVQQTLVGPWALFSYDDVFALLRDPELSVDDANSTPDGDDDRQAKFEELLAEFEVDARGDSSILNTDPPDHTRLRKLVSKAFTPRVIESLRDRIQSLVDEALDPMNDSGHGDVVDELAFALPFDVISEMLGMPPGDTLALRGWSEAMVKTLDPIISDDEFREAFVSARKMDAHIEQVIEWKRANPGDDLLTGLIEAEDDGDRLSSIELRDQVTLLFIAGHETTVNLIGTGIFELQRNPEQLATLRDDPSLTQDAIDELLRFIAPVQFSRRIATKDVTYRGLVIPKGSFIFTCLASANRDPDHFGETADQLILDRPNASQHVSFGSGSHYCLGSSLAKLEAEIAIGTFISRFPDAVIEGEPHWNGRMNLRGLKSLPMKVR